MKDALLFYREFPPHDLLKQFVKCFWTIQADKQIVSTLSLGVIPGGHTDLVFNIGDQMIDEQSRRIFIEKEEALLAGPVDAFRRFRSKGRFEFLGVRFHIGRVPFHNQLSHVRNGGTRLRDLLHPQFGKEIDELGFKISRLQDVTTRIEFVESFLIRLSATWKEPDVTVSAALNLIEQSEGRISVESLAAHVGVTPRKLERKFAQHIGLSPKAFCRVIRFRHVDLLLGKTAEERPGVHLAYACGYSDQTHLIREFRSFTGFTPTCYERTRPVGFFLYHGPNGF